MEAEHREVGVAEARQWDLSCFEKPSGLLSFRWVLQMLLVIARRKPVPSQQQKSATARWGRQLKTSFCPQTVCFEN